MYRPMPLIPPPLWAAKIAQKKGGIFGLFAEGCGTGSKIDRLSPYTIFYTNVPRIAQLLLRVFQEYIRIACIARQESDDWCVRPECTVRSAANRKLQIVSKRELH